MSDETGVWLREGNLIYMLEHTGTFYRGKPQLRNKVWVQVAVHSDTGLDLAAEIAERIYAALSTQQQDGANSEKGIPEKDR